MDTCCAASSGSSKGRAEAGAGGFGQSGLLAGTRAPSKASSAASSARTSRDGVGTASVTAASLGSASSSPVHSVGTFVASHAVLAAPWVPELQPVVGLEVGSIFCTRSKCTKRATRRSRCNRCSRASCASSQGGGGSAVLMSSIGTMWRHHWRGWRNLARARLIGTPLPPSLSSLTRAASIRAGASPPKTRSGSSRNLNVSVVPATAAADWVCSSLVGSPGQWTAA